MFRKTVLAYYRKHGRDLPWRRSVTPYRVVVSEIMLQQTQVGRVAEKFDIFIKQFPSFASLAEASVADVLRAWQGLGYNRRALALKKIADIVVRDCKGTVPSDPAELEKLPGIGTATAGSIAAFGFNKPVVFIETNIRRVFIHFFFPKKKSVHDNEIIPLVQVALNRKNPRAWYSALMDYGAMLAKKVENPNRKSAHYAKQSRFEGSDRQVRGRILKLLMSRNEPFALGVIARDLQEPVRRIREIAKVLEKEKFIILRKETDCISMNA